MAQSQDATEGIIPRSSVAHVGAYVGIHDTMAALKSLVETLETDRLYEGMAQDLEKLADRIRERLGIAATRLTVHGLEPGKYFRIVAEPVSIASAGIFEEIEEEPVSRESGIDPEHLKRYAEPKYFCNGEYLDRWEDLTPNAMDTHTTTVANKALDKLKELVNKIHTFDLHPEQWKPQGTKTGRMDSSKPNEANTPKSMMHVHESQADGYHDDNYEMRG